MEIVALVDLQNNADPLNSYVACSLVLYLVRFGFENTVVAIKQYTQFFSGVSMLLGNVLCVGGESETCRIS